MATAAVATGAAAPVKVVRLVVVEEVEANPKALVDVVNPKALVEVVVGAKAPKVVELVLKLFREVAVAKRAVVVLRRVPVVKLRRVPEVVRVARILDEEVVVSPVPPVPPAVPALVQLLAAKAA
jgi:hypothetical protein